MEGVRGDPVKISVKVKEGLLYLEMKSSDTNGDVLDEVFKDAQVTIRSGSGLVLAEYHNIQPLTLEAKAHAVRSTRLRFDGIALQNSHTLAHCDTTNGDTLYLLPCQCGC